MTDSPSKNKVESNRGRHLKSTSGLYTHREGKREGIKEGGREERETETDRENAFLKINLHSS